MCDGLYESAINKVERAKYEYNLYKFNDIQFHVYVFILLGNLYENLGCNLMALNYYMQCRQLTNKFEYTNPDAALCYTNIASIFMSWKEYKWALRCFIKARDIKEYIIGGDCVDTASTYNNIGVVCFYLGDFYGAYGYFKLSYEIFNNIVGYNNYF